MSIGILCPTGGATYADISKGYSWKKDYGAIAYHADSAHSGNNYYFTWDGTGRYQVKYQQRKRYAWAADNEDRWTDWGNEVLLYSGTGYTSAATIQSGTQVYATSLTALSDAPVWDGTFDAYEYRIMVSAQGADEWTSAEISICYCPEWEVEHAYINPNTGDISLLIDTNTKRPPMRFYIAAVRNTGSVNARSFKPFLSDYTLVPATSSTDCKLSMVLPYKWASYIHGATGDIGGRWTGDAPGYDYFRPATITLDPAYMQDYITAPNNITFEETDAVLQITVPHHAAGGGNVAYQGVTAAYSWTDARGAYVAGSVELTKDNSNWVGDIPCPPYGATVTVEVTANGSKTISGTAYTVYATATVTHDMAPCLRYSLTAGDEFFWLGFNLSFNRQTDVDSDVIALASGRRVARHGKASSTKINLAGVIVDAMTASLFGTQSKWLPDVETLHEPHDWFLRTPSGERYRVAVTSVTRDQGHVHYVTATVEMVEVD